MALPNVTINSSQTSGNTVYIVWISQTYGDTEIQCSLDKSDLWGH